MIACGFGRRVDRKSESVASIHAGSRSDVVSRNSIDETQSTSTARPKARKRRTQTSNVYLVTRYNSRHRSIEVFLSLQPHYGEPSSPHVEHVQRDYEAEGFSSPVVISRLVPKPWGLAFGTLRDTLRDICVGRVLYRKGSQRFHDSRG